MQNCLGEVNLTYCLIYLDDVIVFSETEEEHLQCLHVVLECFQEHNLKLRLSKCEFFHNEINYLAHHVSKEGVQPSKENLKATAEFSPPQTYTKILAFLALLGHYRQFIKGFAHVAQPLHQHLSWESASKKREWVTLTSNEQIAFETFKKACLEVPVLDFADFDKPFLLETNASKLGLGEVLSQKQSDGWYYPVAYVSWALTIHEHNYHSTKQECLALKWVIAEQFKESLCWKPFVVKTDNNPLTYILTITNLDATQHCWVELLAGFTFSIKYQKEIDSAVADALSHIASKLNAEVVKSILDRVIIGTAERADTHDPTVVEANERMHKHFEETAVQGHAAHTCVNLHVTDWVATKQEDPILKIVMEWISSHKVQDLKHILGDHAMMEEDMAILRERKKVTLH